MKLNGVWLPIVTPFVNDKVDFESYRSLIDYYIPTGISGLMPLGTTGETPTLEEDEYEELIEKTMEYVNGRVPVIVGMGGNSTHKVVKMLKIAERNKVQGILSVSPYYNRPDQRGIYEHFLRISEATDLNIVLYNIPYRTGRNIENSTIRKLAELKNIIGIKDACGDIKQTTDLLMNRPDNLSIMTGEDIFLYNTLLMGGDGGVLASAHINTEKFVKMYEYTQQNDARAALDIWKDLYKIIPLLFEEPNPSPIKYYLYKKGLIKSEEVRLPLVNISENLRAKIDRI
ncbi:4-hydroxy-tetrahydrodipicolinate synthase [Clostridium oryzae]|uniref:4-hydroxy-tetrahydrodipicolinate synthase n=1 Tax=Clostridium oryzae TaxID=1450648 RepID=A0A1V4IQS5_9CLOT|nr:4-hydroxy-tetrahydrodipicolinate synthase [Clostridium oryzae]OPJ62381.1 4-hydroxy-tetrahydrodipicolinate synthase [Clostridium oryzae]